MKMGKSLLLPLWSAAFASAQVETGSSPRFAHDALTCMSTEDFPVVEAVFNAVELGALRKAQVYFKAGTTDDWYFVEMEPSAHPTSGEKSQLRAILPKPRAETDRVDYYLFFLSGTFESSQSEEYSVLVSETGCGATRREAMSSPVSLTLHATVAKQPPIPPGFQPQGISGLVTTAGNTVSVGSAAAGGAASGGLSGVTVGLVAGGGAAAAAAFIVTTRRDRDSSSATSDVGQEPGGVSSPTSSTPSPSPTSPSSPGPSPAAAVPDVSGNWQISDRITESCYPPHVGQTSDTTMVIQQDGSLLTVSLTGPDFSANLTGTINATGNLSMRGNFIDEGDAGEVSVNATTTTGSDMTGSYTQLYPERDCTVRGTFSGSKR